MPKPITLYVARDLVNGEVLDVQLTREDAEFDVQAWAKTTLTLKSGERVDCDPRLEVYHVRLGRPVETVDAATCRRRYRSRRRREDRQRATWREERTAVREAAAP